MQQYQLSNGRGFTERDSHAGSQVTGGGIALDEITPGSR